MAVAEALTLRESAFLSAENQIKKKKKLIAM